MNKQEIIAILRSAPSREIKLPDEPKPVKHPTMVWLEEHGLVSEGFADLDVNVMYSGIPKKLL